jgi:hypothetical protein
MIVLAKLAWEDRRCRIAEWVALRADKVWQALGLKRQQAPHHTTLRRMMERAMKVEEVEEPLARLPK